MRKYTAAASRTTGQMEQKTSQRRVAAQSNKFRGCFCPVMAIETWENYILYWKIMINDQTTYFWVTYFRTDPPYTLGVAGFSGQGKKNKGWPPAFFIGTIFLGHFKGSTFWPTNLAPTQEPRGKLAAPGL